MHRTTGVIGSLLLAVALASPALTSGCAARVGVYDEWHHDHHRWDDHEEIVFRGYLTDNHKDYHRYKEMSRDDQKAYWDWRHNHSDP